MSESNSYEITLAKPDGGEFMFEIKPINQEIYYAMMKLIRAGKSFDAYIMALKSLKVSGDDPDELKNDENINCLMALDGVFADMLEPAAATVKKK
jgi:hypothetical protein